MAGYRIGTETLGLGDKDAHVAVKLDATGTPIWARQAGPIDLTNSAGRAITFPFNTGAAVQSATGVTYLAGTFSGSMAVGSTTLTSAGKKDLYLAKLDRDGQWEWARSAGGPEDEIVHDVAIAGVGPLVIGDFAGAAAFGPKVVTSRGGSDIFVAALDPSGAWQSVLTAGSPNPQLNEPGSDNNLESTWAIAVKDVQTIYLFGGQLNQAVFGLTTLNAGTFVAQAQVADSAIPSGTSWAWALGVSPPYTTGSPPTGPRPTSTVWGARRGASAAPW